MERAELVSEEDQAFLFTVVDGQITAVDGPWPDHGGEIEVVGDIPAHQALEDVPQHIKESAESMGQHVCFYDPVHCQTCYCSNKDGRRIRCVRHC